MNDEKSTMTSGYNAFVCAHSHKRAALPHANATLTHTEAQACEPWRQIGPDAHPTSAPRLYAVASQRTAHSERGNPRRVRTCAAPEPGRCAAQEPEKWI
jgi:hypothetical protein